MRWSLIIFLAWVLISSVFSGGEDWPMFQHDPQHTGYSLSNMPESLKIAWVNEPVGEPLIQSLAVSEDAIFVSGYSSLYTLDINTGALIQRYGKEMGFTFPAIKDNKIYLNTNEWIYCLNVDTGEKVWIHSVRYLHFLSYPIFVDGKVFIGGGNPIEFFPQNP